MKRYWLLALCSLVLGGIAAVAGAAEAPKARRLSLDDCLQLALEKNLDLRIQRYNPLLAEMTLAGTYAGYDPTLFASGTHNTSLSGGGFNPQFGLPIPPAKTDVNSLSSSLSGLLPWGTTYSLSGNVGESYGTGGGLGGLNQFFVQSQGSAQVRLTQPLLKNFWIDATRMNIRVAKNRVKYSEQGLRQAVMTTATSVEQAYDQLIYARQFVSVQEKALEMAQQQVAENRKRVQVGAMAPLDEQQAASQAEASRADLIAARSTLAVQGNTLKALLAENYSDWQAVDPEPTASLAAPRQIFDLQLSWSRGLTQRPDVLQAQLDVKRQGVVLKYNFNQLFPELDLVGTYGHGAGGSDIRVYSQALNEMAIGNRPYHAYGGQLTFPLGNTGARANYKSSKLALEQYVLAVKKLERDAMLQIDNDVEQAQSNFERVDATRAAREYAEAALAAEQKKLENGKSTTFEVLRLQRDLTTARGAEIQALVNYNVALSQLSLDEGSTLERLGLDVQPK